MEIQYLNEHLLPGQLGQFFIILSFVMAFTASISFALSAQSKNVPEQNAWRKFGVTAFYIHLISIVSIFSVLFYIIFNHYFEYHYAYSHSSKALPFKYLLSCFWEGQEGSFMLWAFWHALLSLSILHQKHKWVAPVMAVVSLVQVILVSTILGIHIGDFKIGSTPFILLRDQMSDAPIFAQANYLKMIEDGNGLNPLLQNYWMVIHPPILFLGFASTLFPFAYTVAVLWKNDYKDFISPLLKWSVFTGLTLGAGIMLGAAWAYESLNFGGYWAWDPVENSSLVPWIVMIAGLHTLMIFKSSAYSLKSTFVFFLLSFLLVLYSTFLTRTGVLGDTSVHAFTGDGDSLFYHLIFFMFLFLGIGFFLFFKNYKSIPDTKKEEEDIRSREFWMFIGSLVLIISAIQITYTTSMPVWNQMFGTKLTIANPVEHYNKIQLWITFLILVGSGFVYYLKFKTSNIKEAFKKILTPLLISILLTALFCYGQDIKSIPIIILMFAGLFSVCANLFYIIKVIKGKAIKWGGTITHIGFGLMLVGIIFSAYNKHVISVNRLGVALPMGKETDAENIKESAENVMLFRGISVKMDKYDITYIGDTVIGPNHYYRVKYQVRKDDTGHVTEEFVLSPNAQINPKMGLIASPDTKHYLTHDIFTYVTSTIDKSKISDTSKYESQEVVKGDSLFFSNGFMVFNGFDPKPHNANYNPESGDIAISANLKIYSFNKDLYEANPVYVIRNNQEHFIQDTVSDLSLYIRLSKIIPSEEKALIEYKQPDAMNDYIIMKAILFPYINVLWIGTIIMLVGFSLSFYKRINQK
ncbi:MAG TPA: cytochrome c biogenesis protein CcsA [Chitinophagaceae bacterium]|nr:MAG: cytochrome C assembly protein [Bacteroidetes bacterium OLB11]HMN32194.1 cytochrome c biogenesis protein CcsA [Chitinophagaceae bacterium]